MEIRYITESDNRDAISMIYEESWKYAYRGIVPQEFLDDLPESRWVEKIGTPGWYNMVCIENGEYIGTSSFGRSRFEEYPDSGEVITIYLLPEYMGKGYGSKLMDAVMNELRKQGYKEVFLWVLEDNIRARRFYENFGFRCADEYMDDNIGEKKLREVRYVYRFVNDPEPEDDDFGEDIHEPCLRFQR